MFKRLLTILAFLLWSHSLAVAKDVAGVVIFSGKSKYVVNTELGMTVCEWYGGYDLEEGDVVVGQLHQFGLQTVVLVKNRTATSTKTKLWVDNFWLDKDRAIEWLQRKGAAD